MRYAFAVFFFLQAFVVKAEIIFISKSVNLGKVPNELSQIRYSFDFEVMISSSQIYEVIVDCACMVVSYPTQEMPVGTKGSIEVIFEPYRFGNFEKSFIVKHNKGKDILLSLSGYIEPKQLNPYVEFPYQAGKLRFKSKNVNLGKVSGKAPLRRPVKVFNASDTEIFFDSTTTPKHIEVVFDSSKSVLPGQVSEFLIYYHPEYKKEYGLAQDQIIILTRNHLPISLNINATLTEVQMDTSALPRMETEQQEVDLGLVPVGIERLASFKIFNSGKANLLIHNIIPDNECEFLAISSRVVSPQESAELVIRFKSQSKPGIYRRAITVYSNDPENYVAKFYVIVKIAG
jgi:hypothetical protein